MGELDCFKKNITEYVNRCDDIHFLRCLWAFIMGAKGRRQQKEK